MVKVQVTERDVRTAREFLCKQPGVDSRLHDPVAQAIKRLLSKDPRWCSPRVSDSQVELCPRSKYKKLNTLSFVLPRKVQNYVLKFDHWFSNGFRGDGPGTLGFSLKGVNLVDGRLEVK